MPAEVTLHEAAEILGVHYMTAYRYVRQGQLVAHKEGSVWKVGVADLEEFRGGAKRQRPGRRPAGQPPGEHWAERLENRLVAGDGPGAMGVVEAALAAGVGVEEVYLDVVAVALRSIGDRWERGDLDVADEHRAAVLAHELLGRVAARFTRRGRDRGTVVVGAAPGERHSLPVSILADVLRMRGFNVDNLGADVPAASLASAAKRATRLVAVGVSVTVADCVPGAAEAVASLRTALGERVTVFVGGAGITAEQATALGADSWAADARPAVAFVESLVTK